MYVPRNTSFQILNFQSPITLFPFSFSFLSLHSSISLPPSFSKCPSLLNSWPLSTNQLLIHHRIYEYLWMPSNPVLTHLSPIKIELGTGEERGENPILWLNRGGVTPGMNSGQLSLKLGTVRWGSRSPVGSAQGWEQTENNGNTWGLSQCQDQVKEF